MLSGFWIYVTKPVILQTTMIRSETDDSEDTMEVLLRDVDVFASLHSSHEMLATDVSQSDIVGKTF